MKQKLATLLVSAVLLVACTRSAQEESDLRTVSTEKIKALIAGSGFQSRVQLFNLLNPDEKFELWHAHLMKAREQFSGRQNQQAVNKLDELIATITKNVFVTDSKEAAVFSNYFMPQWNQEARKIFTEEELYDIGFNPSADTMGLTAPEDVGGGTGNGSCFCHLGSSGFSCRKIEVRIPTGVTITNGICERSGDCNGSGSGCGWLWLQSCYGNHCNF